jgi:hypothetical protein
VTVRPRIPGLFVQKQKRAGPEPYTRDPRGGRSVVDRSLEFIVDTKNVSRRLEADVS